MIDLQTLNQFPYWNLEVLVGRSLYVFYTHTHTQTPKKKKKAIDLILICIRSGYSVHLWQSNISPNDS